MSARRWTFVLGFLCMPAQVMLAVWTASQDPASISDVRINSSLQIKCSTSFPDIAGLSLRRFFQDKVVMFLSLEDEGVTKNKVIPDFRDRIHISQGLHRHEGEYWVTFELSLLKLEDSDLYYCKWVNAKLSNDKDLSSNGTVIIVREGGPREPCPNSILDLVLIFLGVVAFIFIMSFIVRVTIIKCTKSKTFKPARPPRPPRSEGPRCSCSSQALQHQPYLVTSLNSRNLDGVM